MKKFEEGDVLHNSIKTYPKVKLFMNNGQGHYNKQNYIAGTSNIPVESVGLNEDINPVKR